MVLEIEVFQPEDNAQAKYLVRGFDDVCWTDDISVVVAVVKEELEREKRDEI